MNDDPTIYSEERLNNLKDTANALYTTISNLLLEIKELDEKKAEKSLEFYKQSKSFSTVVKDIENEICKCKI